MLTLPELKEVAAAPARDRRLSEQVREFIRERELRGEFGPSTAYHARRNLLRLPEIVERSGAPSPPFCASAVTAEHVLAYRSAPHWALTTKRPVLAHLRAFLEWGDNPIAKERMLWRIPRGRPRNRRWLTRGQLADLYDTSSGRARLHLAAQGFNGLRECELLRLGWRDVTISPPNSTIALLGKGRNGGKPRTIPLTPTLEAVLCDWKTDSDRVYPVKRSQAHFELAQLGREAGIPFPVSGHVLRRSFGRIAYQAGVPLVDIRNIYGHESVEMTAYYIGVDEEAMAAGLALFDRFVQQRGDAPETAVRGHSEA